MLIHRLKDQSVQVLVAGMTTTHWVTLLGHHIGAMDATRISGTSEQPHQAHEAVEDCIYDAHDDDVDVVVGGGGW